MAYEVASRFCQPITNSEQRVLADDSSENLAIY